MAIRESIAFSFTEHVEYLRGKAGSKFVTSLDLKISGFDHPHDSLRVQTFPHWGAGSKSDSHAGLTGYVWTEQGGIIKKYF